MMHYLFSISKVSMTLPRQWLPKQNIMNVIAELTVQPVAENIPLVSAFIQGIGYRLCLTDDSMQELETTARNTITPLLQPPNRILPENGSDLWINAAFSEADSNMVTLTVRRGSQFLSALTLPVTCRPDRQPMTSTEQQLNAIQSISEVLTTQIHLDDLLRLIVDKVTAVIGADRGTLYLIDEERDELYSKILLEDRQVLSEIRIKRGTGVAGHVAATGEILNIADAYRDQRFLRQFDRDTGYLTRTMLTVPMRNPQQKIIGVVQLLNKKDGLFTARDERMLVAMASQAAISIENARLYETTLKQRLLEQELALAHRIQASFIQHDIVQRPGWSVAAAWEPARDVAGDFYVVHSLDFTRGAFLIADVCGKGVPAALFMSLCVTMLRVVLQLEFAPVQLLHHVNSVLNKHYDESQMFASIFVAYVDFETGEVDFANGGHNPPLLYRAKSDTFEMLTARGVVIGLIPDAAFAANRVVMEPNDVLVLYTDGIVEAQNAAEEQFELDRLKSVIRASARGPVDDIKTAIISAVNDFTADQDPFDDQTLVIVKRETQ